MKLISEHIKLDNGVILRGKRISGFYHKLTEETKDHNANMKKEGDRLNSNYLITFGKHKGKRMVNMTSKEEYEYCVWFRKEMQNDVFCSKRFKKTSRKYKSFSWAVRNNK